MTTDTAVGVTKLVVEDGIALEKIQYVVSNDVVASDECVCDERCRAGHANDTVQCQGICRDAIQ